MTLPESMKYGLVALFVSATLAGCGLDGDDGAQGDTGTQGPQGDAGNDGQNGADGADGSNGQDASLGATLSFVTSVRVDTANTEGAAEILQYHTSTTTIFATNAAANNVSRVSIAGGQATRLDPIALPADVNGTAIGGINSIAINGDLLAVAVAGATQADNGFVLFFNGLNASAPVFLSGIEVGNLPDMVTFTPDGGRVLVANEGEPNGMYSNDPEGTISIIDILASGEPESTADTVSFGSLTATQADLEAMGMKFSNPGMTLGATPTAISVAMDLEPEYIAATNETAYVTLQENNGLAIVNIADLSVNVIGLGSKDWSQYNIDGNENGSVSFSKNDGLLGLYQPDSIVAYSWKDADFLVTANEGDAREYFFAAADAAECTAMGGVSFDADDGCLSYTDEAKISDLTAQANSKLSDLQAAGNINELKITTTLGDADGNGEYETAYAFGARSFTIWDQNGLVVFDSGDDFERITASVHGAQFNNDNDVNEGDSRSEDKGPEPEALAIGTLGDRTYAFIGLERMSGIMMYDITNPYDAKFVDYGFSRTLTEGQTAADGIGDVGPESLVFVPAADNPTNNALLLVGNEVSGTVSIWNVIPN